MVSRLLVQLDSTTEWILIFGVIIGIIIIGLIVYRLCRRNQKQQPKYQNNSKNFKDVPKSEQIQDDEKLQNRMDTSMTKKEFFVIEEEPEKKNDNNDNYNPGEVNESINLSNVFNLEGEGKQYQNTKYQQIRQN
ncbi:unnamed protein product [Paramecium primaurelia]|uniref:Uncharacterized protein n=2 Tax=Paramecium TaxID=5884 RepID=A0A8S1UCW9_9CILI|nr:unnamed protein product [Paramecium primaurelia]CAD8163081.1 unnamed protein product [Paramecium pentaurelia]